MKEENLLKILEFGKTTLKGALEAIASCLSLDFFYEASPQMFTISSDKFVLDILEESCTIVFVDEELNDLSYIQEYFIYYKNDRLMFYNLLKYLNKCLSGTHDASESPNNFHWIVNKRVCSCISSHEYCKVYNLMKIPKLFNIYSHSKIGNDVEASKHEVDTDAYKHEIDTDAYKHEIDTDAYKQSLEDNSHSKITNDMKSYKEMIKKKAPENFASIFTSNEYSKKVFDDYIKKDYFIFEQGDIKTVNKNVFISNKRSPIASLAFLKGCTLKESLYCHKIIEEKLSERK